MALGQGLPLSELRFPGLQTKEWHWPLRIIVKFSGKRPPQVGVEKEVSITSDQVYAGLGAGRDRSLFSGPGSTSRSCGSSGKSYIIILMAHLQETDSTLFYQLLEKAFLKLSNLYNSRVSVSYSRQGYWIINSVQTYLMSRKGTYNLGFLGQP